MELLIFWLEPGGLGIGDNSSQRLLDEGEINDTSLIDPREDAPAVDRDVTAPPWSLVLDT